MSMPTGPAYSQLSDSTGEKHTAPASRDAALLPSPRTTAEQPVASSSGARRQLVLDEGAPRSVVAGTSRFAQTFSSPAPAELEDAAAASHTAVTQANPRQFSKQGEVVPSDDAVPSVQDRGATSYGLGRAESNPYHHVSFASGESQVVQPMQIAARLGPFRQAGTAGVHLSEPLTTVQDHDHDDDDDDDDDDSSQEDEEEHKPLVPAKKPPIEHKWNHWALFLLLWFCAGGGYYFYIRITELNGSYGAFILAVELMGVSSFLPYAILLTRGIYPSGTTGLPKAEVVSEKGKLGLQGAMSTFSNESTGIKHHASGSTYISSDRGDEKPMYLKVPSPNTSVSDGLSSGMSAIQNPLGPPLTGQSDLPNIAIRMSPTAPSLGMDQAAGGPGTPTTVRYGSPSTTNQAAMLLAGSVPNTFPMHAHGNLMSNPLAGQNTSSGGVTGDTGTSACVTGTNMALLQNSLTGYRADDGYRFHVRVLVPCYKEPLEVVSATLNAARGAYLPEKTKRTIYLCDDGKDDAKRALVESLGPDVVYVTGRKRKVNEINGKSANLNNGLKNVIFANYPKNDKGEIDWAEISNKDLLVVFDADMCAKAEFYLRLLEVMCDEEIALCLTPQSFHNISADADLFNNINKQFWECWLPGAFAWGYIACTGTNFCIRCRALAHCNWFPDYTITEDYALGMELKSKGYKATYLMLYLAEGEAPEEIRNCFRQRSRWNKGHFQVFFSARNPLINWGLPFFQRLWYSYAAWAPLCTVVTIPAFMIVPFMSIVFGYNPVTITFNFVLSSTIYYSALLLIQNHCHTWGDWKLMWFANGSNIVLWFTYVKAFINSIIARMGMKVMAFKVTEKVKPQAEGAQAAAAAAVVAALKPKPSAPILQRMLSVFSTRASRQQNRDDHTPGNTVEMGSVRANLMSGDGTTSKHSLTAAAALNRAGSLQTRKSHVVPMTPRRDSISTREQLAKRNSNPVPLHKEGKELPPLVHAPGAPLGSSAYVRGAEPLPSTEAGAKGGWDRFTAVMRTFKPANVRDFDDMFDPLALFILFIFSTGTFAFGVWQSVNSVDARAPATFDLNSKMKGSPYLIISTIWAFFNGVFPYLFLHYCITAGATFKAAAKVLWISSNMISVGSVVIIWMLIPTEFNVREPLDLQLKNYLPSSIVNDTNTNFVFVQGLNAVPVPLSFNTSYLTELYLKLDAAGAAQYGSQRRSLMHSLDLMASDSVLPNDFEEGFDPVGINDADLDGKDDALSNFQRSLLQNIRPKPKPATNAPAYTPFDGVNLSGGLLTKDYVKYAHPMSYTLTQLAWSFQQFPKGFNSGQTDAGLSVIRAGAEYLMRCMLQLSNGKWVFIAQVGDPWYYTVVDKAAVDPTVEGKLWTSYQQDPLLNGNALRKVWFLDEDHIGSDLLAQVAAALASSSMVLKDSSPELAALALETAEKVWAMASRAPANVKPNSFCDFIPCAHNVTVKDEVLLAPASEVDKILETEKPLCYYIDWNAPFTCRMLWNLTACTKMSEKQEEVYSNKLACCSKLTASGIWDKLSTRAQGICALPENQTTCYLPDPSQRTCYARQIDPITGAGCSGANLEVFASPLPCCNHLVQQGSIQASSGRLGVGLCSPASLSDTDQQCYIPSIKDATCLVAVGDACNQFGAETAFTNTTGCCNRLLTMLRDNGFNSIGNIALMPSGVCALPKNSTIIQPPASNNYIISTGSLPGLTTVNNTNDLNAILGGNKRRSLQQVLTDARTALESTINASQWKAPDLPVQISDVCANGACDLQPVIKTVPVAFYNSSTVLDDLAWGAVWMYRATKNPTYLGASQHYLRRHYKEDITPKTLLSDRSYYRSNWNNTAWATNLLLFQITRNPEYEARLKTLLNAWVFGNSLPVVKNGMPAPSSKVDLTVVNNFKLYNGTIDGQSWYEVPVCIATAETESDCFDGIDNDCDGYIDREDVDCGVFPVVYSKLNLAYSEGPSLPNVASVAWLGMTYAESVDTTTARRLRCWALGQVSYIIGNTPGTQSYIVGYRGAPSIVQHMPSSCPVDSDDNPLFCDWDSAFWPQVSNPRLDLVAGALLAGPDRNDQFVESRSSPQTRVSTDGTVPLTGVLAALAQTDTRLRSCELMHGIYQRLSLDESV